MKKWNWELAIFTMIVAAGVLFAWGALSEVHAQAKYTGPRMQFMGQQDLTSNVRFKFFHDQETGQEVICTSTVDADACYLTGRHW